MAHVLWKKIKKYLGARSKNTTTETGLPTMASNSEFEALKQALNIESPTSTSRATMAQTVLNDSTIDHIEEGKEQSGASGFITEGIEYHILNPSSPVSVSSVGNFEEPKLKGIESNLLSEIGKLNGQVQKCQTQVLLIPTAHVNLLLESIAGLRKDVEILRTEVNTLRGVYTAPTPHTDTHQIVTFYSPPLAPLIQPTNGETVKPPAHKPKFTGGGFQCFLELPVELRRQIWRTAANCPRIISVSRQRGFFDHFILPHSRHSTLMKVCREARDEAQKVQLPHRYAVNNNDNAPIIYINRQMDTIWLGNCEPRDLKRLINGIVIDSNNVNDSARLYSVAMGYTVWHDSIKDGTFPRIMGEFKSLGVEEIILVGEGRFNYINSKVQFQRHDSRPYLVLDSSRLTGTCYLGTNAFTWEDLEKEATQKILDVQTIRAEERLELLKEGISLEELDTGDEYQDSRDFSQWTPTRLIYMEAKGEW